MKRPIITLALAAVLLVALAAPAGASTAVWQPSVVAEFAAGDYGTFMEGMAADSHGRLFVSLTAWGYYDETVDPSLWESNIGEVWRVAPNGHKTRVATKDLSPNGMFSGVAVDRLDRLYVGVSDFGDPQTLGSGVYRVGPGGSLHEVMAMPAGTWPNGLACRDGRIFVTDSVTGAVWRARIGSGVASPAAPWFQDALLAPGDPEADPTLWGLGANGIAFRGDTLYVSVSDFGRIVRIPVKADGSPGVPRVICEQPELKSADGIAFDALGGLWIVTNAGTTGVSPAGALYRLSPAAGLWQIADDPGWLNYPTMPVFGTSTGTRSALYVENGAYFSYDDLVGPDIRVLHVGIRGLPVR
jgi:sugar lactone lactonase YvrE